MGEYGVLLRRWGCEERRAVWRDGDDHGKGGGIGTGRGNSVGRKSTSCAAGIIIAGRGVWGCDN